MRVTMDRQSLISFVYRSIAMMPNAWSESCDVAQEVRCTTSLPMGTISLTG